MKGEIIQILSTFIVSGFAFQQAFSFTWPSYTLGLLESDQSPVTSIMKSDSNLIGSLPMLGCFIANMFGGHIIEKFGRKNTIVYITGTGNIIAAILIITAKNITQLLLARFIIGISGGVYSVALLVFISEYGQASLKSYLMTVPSLSFASGGLVSYILGWVCSYTTINYFVLTSNVIGVIMTSFLKESPVYLLRKRKEKEALVSLKFYRGASESTAEVLEELLYLKNQIDMSDVEYIKSGGEEHEKLNKQSEQGMKDNEHSAWKILRASKPSQYALIIITTHEMLSVMMGSMAVQTYAGPLFTKAVPTLSPHMCSVIMASVGVVCNILATAVCDLFPRRILMISSCTAASICLAVLGLLLRWPFTPAWIIPALILLFNCSYTLGSCTVPFIQLSESFPPQLKGFATTVVMCFMWLGNFFLLATFGPIVQYVDIDGAFFTYATFAALNGILAFFLVRETRGQPYEIVRDMYDNGLLYRRQIINNMEIKK